MSTALLIAGSVLAIGAFVQGVVGFGIALVGVPIAALVQPDLVPGALILLAPIHPVLSVVREHRDVDWRGVGWTMAGRLPGTVLGVLIVSSLPQRPFLIVVGLAVLAFVGLSMVAWRPRPTAPALATAGVVSGTFGTATAIGGPPVALLYQHEPPARIRATLAAVLLLGALLSAVSLAVAGQLDGHDVASAGLLVPFILLGFALSGSARRLVDGGRIRYAVLGVAGLSALALIARSALS